MTGADARPGTQGPGLIQTGRRPSGSSGSPSGRPVDRPPGGTPAPRRAARLGAVTCLVLVLLAVTWPSGSQIAGLKDGLGPWFLSEQDKDVVLNLVMLAPPTFLATIGWQRVPWWAWALAGCALGCCAELAQLLAPLDRRPSLDNVVQNAVGAWAGALAALVLLRRPWSARRTGAGAGH
ncbi:MAG: VanZ family protein [Actinomyces sp.]|uniref:VanZ family protein n=1 Tax=Actinomyces sp. TaxID=29317 RepID=UPI0026DB6511|nr:VanZ family protein [Actinomyces sp.]MDO4242763.1 VanZ family protein [Actinomyces sp.]